MHICKVKDNVQIFCQFGLVEEGVVIGFNEQVLQIQRKDKSIATILKPMDNIICVRKLMPSTEKPKENKETFLNSLNRLNELIKKQHDSPEEKPLFEKESLRAARLADLYKVKSAEERKMIKDLLSQTSISNSNKVNYGYPSFFKPSVSKHTKKKT